MPCNCAPFPREGGHGLAFWRRLELRKHWLQCIKCRAFMGRHSFSLNIPFHPFLFSAFFYYFASSSMKNSGNMVRSDKSLYSSRLALMFLPVLWGSRAGCPWAVCKPYVPWDYLSHQQGFLQTARLAEGGTGCTVSSAAVAGGAGGTQQLSLEGGTSQGRELPSPSFVPKYKRQCN